MNGVKPTGSESERDFLIEVISWGEDIDTGRWGYDRAAEMLDGYVAARVAAVEAEHDEARARLVALLEAISMLGKGEVAAYGRAAARGDS